MKLVAPDPDRFWGNVEKGPGCWPWRRHLDPWGYGRLTVKRNGVVSNYLAHRVAWELTHGPIPEGLVVCHRCDNPRCCNPDHLFLGTQRDNVLDMHSKGRSGAPGARLDPEKVRAIRALAAEGVCQAELATRFGVSKDHVQGVITRRWWRHIA